MKPEKPPRMELLISDTLRAGVILSAIVIAVGTIALVVSRDTGYAHVQALADVIAFRARRGAGYFPIEPAEILRGVLAFKPYAVIAVGMALLVLTPILRVAMSVLFFVAERDWTYVLITLFVLVVLLASFAAGIG